MIFVAGDKVRSIRCGDILHVDVAPMNPDLPRDPLGLCTYMRDENGKNMSRGGLHPDHHILVSRQTTSWTGDTQGWVDGFRAIPRQVRALPSAMFKLASDALDIVADEIHAAAFLSPEYVGSPKRPKRRPSA